MRHVIDGHTVMGYKIMSTPRPAPPLCSALGTTEGAQASKPKLFWETSCIDETLACGDGYIGIPTCYLSNERRPKVERYRETDRKFLSALCLRDKSA